MPHLNYLYKVKKEDRHDFQAQFMIPKEIWEKFKKVCESGNTTPSQKLRKHIKEVLGIAE